MTTGFVFHEIYLWHNTGNAALLYPSNLTVQPGEHAENPETKRRMKNLLEVSGLTEHLVNLKARPATDDELARFHTRDHIEKIRNMSDAGGAMPAFLRLLVPAVSKLQNWPQAVRLLRWRPFCAAMSLIPTH